MIQKKNLWFLTLFSLVLVLSVYYITMPNDILLSSQLADNTIVDNDQGDVSEISETSIVETMKLEDEVNTLDEINSLKETIAQEDSTTEDKNKAFDAIKLLNQISSQEELLEEKIKTIHELDSFVDIDDDQIRVVIDSDNHSSTLANNIMRTIQNNFETKQYISVSFK